MTDHLGSRAKICHVRGTRPQKQTPSILREFQDQMQTWWLQSHQRDHKRHKVFGEEHSRVLKCYLWGSAGPPYSIELVGERPFVTECHEQADSSQKADTSKTTGLAHKLGLGLQYGSSWAMFRTRVQEGRGWMP